MVCYEGKGVPVDIELLNTKADLECGIDPLITRALDVLRTSEDKQNKLRNFQVR
jgi:hypothetical protein